MTKILIKLFIKNSDDINNPKIREKYGILGSIVGIVSNILLFIIKFIIGIILNSVAISADSFNNLSDSASSIITFVGFKMGNKPADAEHPFGHGRMEYISGLLVSFIIIMIGFEFFKSSVTKIFNPEEVVFNIVSVIILCITALIKVWQGMFNKTIGKKINSKSLIATATDSMNDVLVTCAAIISIFISHFTKFYVDGWFGAFVAVILMYSGFKIAKEILSPLIGEYIDPELSSQIKQMVLSYDGILGVHDLLVHNYGPNRSMASIHAEVPHDVDINISHEIIDRIEREVSKNLGIFLVIHMDPVNINDKRVMDISNKVKLILNDFGLGYSAHDFRIVDGINDINIIFDMVIPHKCSNEEQNKALNYVKDAITKIDKRYNCVINVEKSFEME